MKQYTRPEIEIITNVLTNEPLAASPTKEQVTGDRLFRWGNGVDPYGNGLWVNEGPSGSTRWDDPLVMGGDDDGTIDSRAKGGNLWDD